MNNDVLGHELQTLLEDADLDVVRRHLGDQQDEHVVVVFDGGIQLGIGGLDGAAESAPEIDFPGQIEAHVRIIEEARDLRLGRIGHGAADGVVRIFEESLLQLREQISGSDVAQGASRQDARSGRSQIEILAVCPRRQNP